LGEEIQMALGSWSLVAIFELVILVTTVAMLAFGWLMGAKGKNPIRDGPFESGQTRLGEARLRYMMQYYPYLIMYVAFDVIAMFLFTWGLVFATLPFAQEYLFLVFVAILAAPLWYALHISGKRDLW